MAACLLEVTVGHAATVDDLYTIVIEPDATASNPRSDAIQRAMSLVLVRVTGSRDAATAPELQPIVRDAERRYLNSYALLEGGEVRVGFIPGSVDQALEALDWPVWGTERPLTMLWIAVEDALDGRAILSTGELDNPYEYTDSMRDRLAGMREEIEQAAYERGLPYALPMMDFEDMLALDFADVWHDDFDVLASASLRYAADTIAVVRVSTSAFGLSVEWTVRAGEDQRIMLGTGLAEGIDWLAEQYARQFGVAGGERTLRLIVSGVQNLRDYGRVMSYLSSISILDGIDVSGYEDGTLQLVVSSRGDDAVIQRVLSLSNLLIPDRDDDRGSIPSSDLRFELTPGARLQ